MSSLVIDRIGLLVTNQPELGEGPLGLVRDASVVLEDDRVVAIEPAGAAADERLDARRSLRDPGLRRQPHPPRLRRRPRRRVRRPPRRRAVHRWRHPAHGGHHPGGRRRCARGAGGGATGCRARRGDHDGRVQVGLRPRGRERATLVRDCSRVHRRRHLPRRPRGPGRVRGPRRRLVDLVRGEMLAACAPVCRWIDVFCERGAFDAEQSGQGRGGRDAGRGPGRACAEPERLPALGRSWSSSARRRSTTAPIRPTSTSRRWPRVRRSPPSAPHRLLDPPALYPDARRAIDAGAQVAIATNCNPGSSNTTSIGFLIALAVREMGMTIDEAVLAATLGGARALHRDDLGRLAPGSRADAVLLAGRPTPTSSIAPASPWSPRRSSPALWSKRSKRGNAGGKSSVWLKSGGGGDGDPASPWP